MRKTKFGLGLALGNMFLYIGGAENICIFAE